MQDSGQRPNGHSNRALESTRSAAQQLSPANGQADEHRPDPYHGISRAPLQNDAEDHTNTSSVRAGLLRNDDVPQRTLTPGSQSSSIPADDGMQLLRQQMHRIREMALSTEEKAHRMHALMVEEYEKLKSNQADENAKMIVERGRPITRDSLSASHSASASSRRSTSVDTAFRPLDPEELEPTYYPHDRQLPSHVDSDTVDDASEEPTLGCEHYMRNIKVQCPQCERFYTCRHCHDEAEDHLLVRKNIRNILCMLCGLPQRAAEYCRQCEEQTACYYCDICKLWDNDSTKKIYHCPDCGICRMGEGIGKDYIHCIRCNVCVNIQHAQDHRCVERATDCDCPICGEYMFSSSTAVVAMKCGHYIHRVCYDDLMNTTYKCPICSRSAVNMELQWRKMDECLESQPMPEQYRDTKAWIICNDCNMRSCVPFHWLGNKCRMCDSYNTNQDHLINEPREQSRNASNIEAEQHHVAQAAGLHHPNSASLTGIASQSQSQPREVDEHMHSQGPSMGDLARSVDDDISRSEVAYELPPARLHTPIGHLHVRAPFPSPPSPLDPDQELRPRRTRDLSESSASAPASIISETDDEMGFWGAGINPGDYMPSMPQMPQMPTMPSLPRMPSVSMPSMPNGWRSPRLFAREDEDQEDVPPAEIEQRGWGLGLRQWRLGSPTEFFRSHSPDADAALSDDDLALEGVAEEDTEPGLASRIGWDPRLWRLPGSPTLFGDRHENIERVPDIADASPDSGSGWGIDPRQWRFGHQGLFGRSRSVDTAILHSSAAPEETSGTSPSSIWDLQPRRYLARRFGSFSIHANSDDAESLSGDGGSEESEENEDSRESSDGEEEDEVEGSGSEKGDGDEAEADELDLPGHR